MQMQFPTMSPLNKGLVIAFVSSFLLNTVLAKFASFSLIPFFGLSGGAIMQGKIWSLVTYALFPSGLMECLFDGLIFWFIGSELENMWGPRRYVYFLLTTILGGALIFLIVSFLFFYNSSLFGYPIAGPAGVASTMCVAYGVLFPNRTMYFFFFPMQAKWFVILLIGMNLYHGLLSHSGLLAWSQLGAMASGFVWMMMVSNPQLKSLFQGSGVAKEPYRSRRKGKKVSHLHIVEDPKQHQEESDDEDDQGPPTYH